MDTRVIDEIKRTRSDLDQFKNRQRLGADNFIAAYGGPGTFSGWALAAGTKQAFTISAWAMKVTIIEMSVSVFVDVDNDTNYMADWGPSLSAGQRKVDVSVYLNKNIPPYPGDDAWPGTQWWLIVVRNNDTVAHNLYIYAHQLFPLGSL